MKDQQYNESLNMCKDLKRIRSKQRLRGVNNFNIFTTLFKSHEEVRLHSRFLAFILDPHASHCQDSLFLKKFLALLGWEDFLDVDNTYVYAEHRNIDIYLTDGEKHILLENKIHAGDQDRQIKRYIETILLENQNPNSQDSVGHENIAVIYLTLDRSRPHSDSIGEKDVDGYRLADGCLKKNNGSPDEKVMFASLNYRNANQTDILDWVEDCLNDVYNITNISFGLKQYKDVVLSLYGIKNGGDMSLREYLQNKPNAVDIVKQLQQVSSEIEELQKDLMTDFWEQFQRSTLSKLDGTEWALLRGNRYPEFVSKGKQWGAPIYAQLGDEDLIVVGIQFSKAGAGETSKQLTAGVLKNPERKPKPKFQMNSELFLTNPLVKHSIDNIPGGIPKVGKPTGWWLYRHTLYKDSLFELVIEKYTEDKKMDELIEAMSSKFMRILNHFHDAVVEANKVAQRVK